MGVVSDVFMITKCQIYFPCTCQSYSSSSHGLPWAPCFGSLVRTEKNKHNAFPSVNGFGDKPLSASDGELKLNFLVKFCCHFCQWSLESSTEVNLDLFWYLEDQKPIVILSQHFVTLGHFDLMLSIQHLTLITSRCSGTQYLAARWWWEKMKDQCLLHFFLIQFPNFLSVYSPLLNKWPLDMQIAAAGI